jgi:AcrR family transcriptional regulator
MNLEKKVKILECAKKRFERFGFRKTTVDEIAEEVGVSKRTLYELFDSKEKILAELVITEARSFRAALAARLRAVPDPSEKIRILVRLTEEYFAENPFLRKVLSDELGMYAPFLKDEIGIIEESMERIFQNIVIEGIESGAFCGELDEKVAAHCIFLLFRSFTYAQTPKEAELGRKWVDFILKAVEKRY